MYLARNSSLFYLTDSDLQKVATIVEKQLTVKIEPLVQTYVSSVLKKTTQDLERKNNNLLKEVSHVNRKYTRMENNLDSMEQYSRRNALRISGVPEKPLKNTDEIVVNIATAAHTSVRFSDIDYSHRAGKAKGDRPRDIIVRFVSHNAKEKLYDARTHLANSRDYSSVTIHEHLTRTRKKLLIGARKLVKENRIKKTWTQNGKVYILNLKDKRKKINKESDLDKFKKKGVAGDNASDNSTE